MNRIPETAGDGQAVGAPVLLTTEPNLHHRVCLLCGKSFTLRYLPSGNKNAYCSRSCAVQARIYPPLLERFMAKVDRSPEHNGCWLWTAVIDHGGYGRIKLSRARKMAGAHRVAYELFKGQIPDGLDLDHLCRNRRCVNPEHLEPVSRRENALRGVAPMIQVHLSGKCKNGLHDLTPENTYNKGSHGGGQCAICARERMRAYRGRHHVAQQ